VCVVRVDLGRVRRSSTAGITSHARSSSITRIC
jgi:hypothetical protein